MYGATPQSLHSATRAERVYQSYRNSRTRTRPDRATAT